MFSKTLYVYLAVIAAVTPQAVAELFTTNPTATTVCNAGQSCAITWNDDGVAPALAAIGPCSIGLYAGSAQQQTILQLITASLDVSTTATVAFTPDATVGPDYNGYFIKFISLGLKNPVGSATPYEQFSAKFTLSGMTGTFNSTVQSEISGASVPPTSTPGSTSSASKISTTTTPASVSKSSTTASATKTSGASKSFKGVGLGIVGGVMAALSLIV